MNWDQIGSGLPERAAEFARNGCSCSEAVACAFGPLVGCDAALALRASSGFAGGMGGAGETCGAVAAALMILGMRFGETDKQGGPATLRAKKAAAEFMDRFVDEAGSTMCGELCPDFSLRTPEGARAIRESGEPERLVRCAADILFGILGEEA